MIRIKLFISSVSVCSLIPFAIANAAASPNTANSLQILGVASAFRTSADFLRLLAATNSVTESEAKSAADVLSEAGLSLNQLMPAPRIQGDKVFFGKYYLRIRADGHWATQGGRELRNSGDASFSENLAANIKLMNAEHPKRASTMSLLWNSAWALDSDLSAEAQSGQIGWAAMVVAGKTALAKSQMTSQCGRASFVEAWIDILSVVKLTKEHVFDSGKVVCSGEEFRKFVPEEFYSALAALSKSSPKMRDELKSALAGGDAAGVANIFDGVATQCATLAKASLDGLQKQERQTLEAFTGGNLLTARKSIEEIPAAFLRDAFKGGKIPACDKAGADVVQKALAHKPYSAWDGMMNVAKKLTTFRPPQEPTRAVPGSR